MIFLTVPFRCISDPISHPHTIFELMLEKYGTHSMHLKCQDEKSFQNFVMGDLVTANYTEVLHKL